MGYECEWFRVMHHSVHCICSTAVPDIDRADRVILPSIHSHP
jgi:hypothetical protein